MHAHARPRCSLMAAARPGTSAASACRCWCCSASSGSCRKARGPARTSWRAPCANGIGGPAHAERRERAVVGNAPERQDGGKARHRGDAAGEERAAGADLGRRRLVLRRHAAHGVGDHAIGERERVVGRCGVASARKAELEQCGVEQVAGEVAGEGSPGAVGAPETGGQAHDQQACARRARMSRRRRCTRRARPAGSLRGRRRGVGTADNRGGPRPEPPPSPSCGSSRCERLRGLEAKWLRSLVVLVRVVERRRRCRDAAGADGRGTLARARGAWRDRGRSALRGLRGR